MTNRFSFVFFWIVLLPLSSLTVNAMTSSSSSAVKRILVTGGNKGIGKAICERLLSEWPVTHVLLASRSLERGQQAVQDIQQALGGDATVKDRLVCIELDTSNDKSVQAAAALLAQQPELYGIINNAGVRHERSPHVTVPDRGAPIFQIALKFFLDSGWLGILGGRDCQCQLLWPSPRQ